VRRASFAFSAQAVAHCRRGHRLRRNLGGGAQGQWSSTAAMGNYLHDDEEGKQEAQIKRIKQRAKSAKQEARK
jgi:hypothetical protein